MGLKGLLTRLRGIKEANSDGLENDIKITINEIEEKIIDSITEAQNDFSESLKLIEKRLKIEEWLSEVMRELNSFIKR